MPVAAAVAASVNQWASTNDRFSVGWHGGEPLAAGRVQLAALMAPFQGVEHHVQTNATLIDDAWCEFFVEHGMRVSVSIDGPARHDARRVDRGARPAHQRILKGIDTLRRHGIAIAARKLTSDVSYKGVDFRAGDMILPPGPFVGLDRRANPDPLAIDFNRGKATTAPFGAGRHACPGANLARRELQIFLEEWLPRIQDFRIRPGTKPEFQMSTVNAITRLDLVWP